MRESGGRRGTLGMERRFGVVRGDLHASIYTYVYMRVQDFCFGNPFM